MKIYKLLINTKILSVFVTILTFILMSSASQATILSFENITNNSNFDLSAQLSVEITSDSNNAYFKVLNDVNSGIYASITDIYFDFDTNLTAVSFLEDSGSDVAFTDGASPSNLPGGGDPSINFSSDYSTDANQGNKNTTLKANGVDATNEYITFLATLSSSFNFLSLMDEINDGSFRIGFHIQAISDGNDSSDSYVSAVPVPAAAWLFGTALFGFFVTSRRIKNTV